MRIEDSDRLNAIRGSERSPRSSSRSKLLARGEMTFAEESSPLGRQSLRSDGRQRFFHKRYLCSWILAALLHFILLRMVFISQITFPFKSSFSSPVSIQSDELLSQPLLPANGRDVKSFTGIDTPPLIRLGEDSWATDDDNISHELNHPGDKRKVEHHIIRKGSESSTEGLKPSFSTTGKEDKFGLPEDNEKEELELEASEVARKSLRRTMIHPPVAEEAVAKAKSEQEAKDRIVARNTQQTTSEGEKKQKIQSNKDRDVAGLPDDQHASAQSSSTDEQGAQNRKAEHNKNVSEKVQEEDCKGQAAAKEKEAEVMTKSEDGARTEVDESRSNASDFTEEQRGAGNEMANAGKNVPDDLNASGDKMPAGEQPRSYVTKSFQDQRSREDRAEEHGSDDMVTEEHHLKDVNVERDPSEKVHEELHQDINPANRIRPEGQCDLFEGEWEHDPEGPLYTNSTCFYMQEAQNCMGNGRPDTQYMYWKWKPRDCDLPRFDAKSFLESFKGKAIGFVGDSIARNQMQSLLCLLSQVEIPSQTYVSADDSTVRWLFKDYQVTLAGVWSPYLLKESNAGVMGFEKGQSVLYLDELDTSWTSVMADFDTLVFVTGQWYYKTSVYIDRGEVVGCHYCPTLNVTQIGFYQAYRRAIRQVLEKVSNEFKGISIMSTFPLSHFQDGAWDKGGNCRSELPLNLTESKNFPGDHNEMRQIVLDEFDGVVTEIKNLKKDARLEILDVTRVALQRADGHPGPFRRPHPFDGRDPDVYFASDCLHWCLPGPIEAWNQLVAKILDKYLFQWV